MIRLLTSALLVAVFSSLIGCQSDSPKASAQEFLNSFYQMDFDRAIALSTPQQAELVKQVEQFASLTSDSVRAKRKNVVVEIVNIKEDGDEAVITFKNSLEPSEQTLRMIKKEGQWLANNSKEDIADELNGDAPEEQLEETGSKE